MNRGRAQPVTGGGAPPSPPPSSGAAGGAAGGATRSRTGASSMVFSRPTALVETTLTYRRVDTCAVAQRAQRRTMISGEGQFGDAPNGPSFGTCEAIDRTETALGARPGAWRMQQRLADGSVMKPTSISPDECRLPCSSTPTQSSASDAAADAAAAGAEGEDEARADAPLATSGAAAAPRSPPSSPSRACRACRG